MFPYQKRLCKLAAAVLLALPMAAGGTIVNVDLNGVSNFPGPEPDPLNPTYVGQGPAGGGTNFNGVLVDSRLPGGAGTNWQDGDFYLTIIAENLLDSDGNPTAISFTASPVGGDGGATAIPNAADSGALFADYIFVGYAPHPADATAAFTISGLGSLTFVDLYFYGAVVGPITIPGAAPATFTDVGIFNSGNTRYFKQVPVTDGQVSGTFGSGTVVSGFTVATPEPHPFVKSVAPTGGSVRQDAAIQVELEDYVTQVATNTIQLFLNGAAVTPTISKPAGSDVTTVTYTPPTILPQRSANTVMIVFSDTGTPPFTQTNEFSFVVVSEATAAGTVNIDFDGFRVNDTPAITYVGQGAAGGGTVFNGLSADSTLPDGSNNDALTVNGNDLLNSLGDTTTVGFSIATVGGRNTGAATDPTTAGALFNDAIFVSRFGQQSGSAAFSITGLTSPGVDLYFYVGPESASQPVSVEGRDPSPFAGGGIFTSANTVYFSHAPVSGGKVSGTLGTTNLAFAAISGLTIVTPLPHPYVSSTAPAPRGAQTNAVISVVLQDYVAQVVTNSIQLLLNGLTVTPVITKPAGSTATTVSYTPPDGLIPGSSNVVRVVFSDNATPPVTQTNEFGFLVARLLVGSPLTIAINFRADDAGGLNGVMFPDDSAGVNPTVNWNNVPGANLNVAGLIDSTGAATPANLDIVSTALQLFQVANTAIEPGDQEMMRGHIYCSGGNTIDVTVSGLTATYTGPGYDLYIYWRSGTGAWPHTYTILDDSGATVAGPAEVADSNVIGFDGTYVESDGNGSAGHYYVFSNLKLANFTIHLEAPSGSYTYISGLQIQVRGSGPPVFKLQPQSQHVAELQPVTFSAFADGEPPMSYQWLRNGVAIEGATNKNYTIPSVTRNDEGAQFSVQATNALGSATSSTAVLTVEVITTGPTLVAAQTVAGSTKVTVAFSTAVSASTATAKGNYAINNGISVSQAVAISSNIVVLTTSPIPSGTTTYTLTVNGVQDLVGNSIAADSQIPIAVIAGADAVSSGSLQLWLKADTGVTAGADSMVSQWNDQSTNHNNALQADPAKQPLLVPGAFPATGKPALRFDGVQTAVDGDYLQGSGQVDIPAGFTSFLVYLMANTEPRQEQVALGIGVPGQASANRFNYIRSGFGGGDNEMSFAAWANDYGTGFSIPPNTHRIWTMRLSDDMTRIDLYDSDGTTESAFSRASQNLLPPGAGYYVAGLGEQARNLQGDIAEVIVYKGALSDTDRVTIENYLVQKYLVAAGPEPIRVSIAQSGQQLVISWTAAGTLQSADSLAGPWSDMNGQTSPYTFTPSGTAKFYRLRQ
ncbi:MAG: immunoglobulin domain-containing protein [Candidatus Omnitrophica bacterium]|nr:immunoglobulin domain-containing protein [Candidatus Omnitrophota bacterium]